MRRSLTKNQILRLKTDIDRVFKAGKRLSSSCFKLLVVDNGLPYSRLIVIPVKHYGNSVQRNYIRRQVKEIFRNNQDKIVTNVDCVVVVYPHKALTYEEKESILISLFTRSGVTSL
ncbi:MAG: ribonuclease P protein component [Sphaerochaetaceae bacterium]|nr:ribonuclease P protein component [Sphaerochaetaceae bacterium]